MVHDKDEVEGRKGSWMHTSLGGKFFPADPRPSEVFISDIANGLAQCVRYAGQGRVDRFYSVAEHSVILARHFMRTDALNPELAFVALLHDAAEAYLTDLPRAVKEAQMELGGGYSTVERAVQDCIWIHYNLMGASERCHEAVKDADRRIIRHEKDAIMRHPQQWAADALPPLPNVNIFCWAPATAKRQFLLTYEDISACLGLTTGALCYD